MSALWIFSSTEDLLIPAYIPHSHLITLARVQKTRTAVCFVQPVRDDRTVIYVDSNLLLEEVRDELSAAEIMKKPAQCLRIGEDLLGF